MSMKNHYLLHRSGRNQFGDPGAGYLAPYQPSAEELERDNQMFALHKELNERFARTHGGAWLDNFAGLDKKTVWQILHPNGRPSMSTFYKQIRESGSLSEFLLWWLVCFKTKALRMLGQSPDAIRSQLQPFSECGRYYVNYGKSERIFGTSI